MVNKIDSAYFFGGTFTTSSNCDMCIGLYRFDITQPAASWNQTYFPGGTRYFSSVAYLPASDLGISGTELILVAATTMTLSKTVSATYSGINFGYIVCIDSTTCIAADLANPGGQVVIYAVNQATFINGNPSSMDVLTPVNMMAGTIVGTAAINTTPDNFVCCSVEICAAFSTAGPGPGFIILPPSSHKFGYKITAVFSTSFDGQTFLGTASQNAVDIWKYIAPDSWENSNPNFGERYTRLDTKPTTDSRYFRLAKLDYLVFSDSASDTIYFYEKQPCHSSCATCSGANSNQCLSCPIGSILSGTTCTPCAPVQYLSDALSDPPNTCTPCQATCSSCVEAIKCTACLIGRYLDTTTYLCVAVCPVCFYPDDTSNSCLPCPDGCESCLTAPPLCNQCSPGLYFGTNNSCTLCNGDGLITFGSNCVSCHGSCKSCAGQSSGLCTSCHGSNALINTNPGSCGICTGANYIDPSSICRSCDP